MVADNNFADFIIVWVIFADDIADDITVGSFILIPFDVESEDHYGELPLFVGCIVDYFVSSLICMFQDSVPAGSI